MNYRVSKALKAARRSPNLRANAEKLCLTDKQLWNAEYPRRLQGGKVEIFDSHKWRTNDIPSETTRICMFCLKEFAINSSGEIMARPCTFHPNRTKAGGSRWRCCNRRYNSPGCTTQARHFHCGNLRTDQSGYIGFETPGPTSKFRMYALDTERLYTVKGMEVADITVVDVNNQIVYRTKILPDTPIIDYNTKFSGLTAADFAGNTKRLQQVHEDLKTFISSDTILVGHGMQNDFWSLKICHNKVIDTAILYGDEVGPGKTPSLRVLAKNLLGKSIQAAQHDSREDCIAAMKLTLLKISKMN